MLQIDNVDKDPLIRAAVLMALVYSLWSLAYGCIYIIRFMNMRSIDRAMDWVEVGFPSTMHHRTLDSYNSPIATAARRRLSVVEYLRLAIHAGCLVDLVSDHTSLQASSTC